MKTLLIRFLATIWVSFGLAWVPNEAGAQSTLRALKSGFWEGAVRADAEGNVMFCYLLGRKNNDEFTIQLYWKADGFHVLIYSSDWDLIKGEEFKGRVRIDKKFDSMIEASVFDSESLDYVFGFNEKARKAFQSGSRIFLEGPAGERSFRLNGTRKALEVLMDCADEYFAEGHETSSVSSANINVGANAYNDGDYATAIENWRPLADQGDALAQTYLGEMYKDGEGVEKDYNEAASLFRQAANQGNARAQNFLGVLYYRGDGVPKDYAKAFHWFRKSAEGGFALGQNNLAEMYRDGEGVDRDDKEAARWFRMAIDQGHERAQSSLDALLASSPPNDPQSPAPSVTLAAEPSVAPTQPSFKPGQAIEVSFADLPAEGQDWLAISATNHTSEQYYELVMLEGKPSDGTHTFKSLPEGEYEVRLYLNWPDGGYDIAASSRIVISSASAPAPSQEQPLPTSPQPAQPVSPIGASTDEITGGWIISSGMFEAISFDQVTDLVDGVAKDPEGQFEGEFAKRKLTGWWATSDSSVGAACDSQRLGQSNWGSLEATISDDGTTLTGAWSECDKFRTHTFVAAREDAE